MKTMSDWEKMNRDLSILIVDDDRMVTTTIEKILKSSNPDYYIESVYCVEQAIELVKKTYWDTILLDLSLPIKDGEQSARQHGLRTLDFFKQELHIPTPIIAITGYQDDEISDIVLDKGAYYFLTKPLKPKSLATIVKNSTKFQLSGYDGLTGLLNRRTFEERLKSEFERAKRKNQILDDQNTATPPLKVKSFLSLLFIDCDNFKEINDNYSHLGGDRVLKSIGSSFVDEAIYRFLDSQRQENRYIIRPYDIASRFGGDEFTIYLPETDQENAITVAKRIRTIMKEMKVAKIVEQEAQKREIEQVTLSIGITTYPYPNFVLQHSDLIKLADEAMYKSKQHRIGEIFGYNEKGEIMQYT